MSGPHEVKRATVEPIQATRSDSGEHLAIEQAHQCHKTFATLQARAALRGYSLQALADDTFLVHRWNLARALPDLRAVRDFLEQVGA